MDSWRLRYFGVRAGPVFSLHVIAVPLALALLVVFHLVALRTVGSNNPDGLEIKDKLGPDGKPLDGIPFHPYYIVKDMFSVAVFLAVFAGIVFCVPTFGGIFLEAENFEPANAASTPEHIAPVWYFTCGAQLFEPAAYASTTAVGEGFHGMMPAC
jgi:ubiquinol-cytochrome c reductase cytochrome b subunit